MKPSNRVIPMELEVITCDPAQYKPYNPTLHPAVKVIVEVPVPDDGFVDPDGIGEDYNYLSDEPIVLNIEGFKALVANIAAAMIGVDQLVKDNRPAPKRNYINRED